MPWLHEVLNTELVRVSATPITPLTLLMLLVVALGRLAAEGMSGIVRAPSSATSVVGGGVMAARGSGSDS